VLDVTSTDVCAGAHFYSVLIGAGLLGTVGKRIREKLPPTRCAIISDTNVAPRFADKLQKSLSDAGFQQVLITVPAGEQSKTLERAGEVCEEMLSARLDRQSLVAAIFERGIPHAQIPTTLLAMVDSSIGGKTGVNARAGKNLIGAFHQPMLAIDDMDVLRTLPPRELSQGFAEMIKHAIIADAEMFGDLKQFADSKLDGLKPSSLAALIRRNVEIKSRMIANDERDQKGQRALLNFGHTVGHGIERAVDYRGISHGEAVSLGMVAASDISVKKAGLPKKERDAIVELLKEFQLPTSLLSIFPREKIFEALKFDKKFERGRIRFIVTSKIGSAQLSNDVTMEDIREAVDKL
jgi:3-dehydroquinate synthase